MNKIALDKLNKRYKKLKKVYEEETDDEDRAFVC
jgi:hypothetical protein